MKKLDAAFEAHIKSGATTLCNCWLMTKRNDQVLGFTDHDQVLEFDGHEFHPTAGFSPSATVQKGESAIDTSDVMGWLDDDRISPLHIRDGQFAGATVDTFKVNWRDISIRHHFRRDFIGEVSEKDGVFRAELRSQHIALNQVRGKLYQRTCNASFGDVDCGVDALSLDHSSTCTIEQIIGVNEIVVSGLQGRANGFADGGHIKWLTGERKNRALQILRHIAGNPNHCLFVDETDNELAQVGDTVRVTVGCDKHFSTCKAKFSNHLNFRGFPHIPGEAFILKYPSADNPLDGRVLVK
ncbi:DUF2163 domain-containing protein [Maritalea porphyrae]|uniref:DUF2163 domain-containing protein n=1 Tax=Maritalea porphyrae TaxID=880732 RepID=UPI0022AF7F7A|nr:DUF2163 domain-containing protein [Maritalea porphyrae]MCZ4271151.1 DUF2163 domain-containing protein [Maritalea porphyrae]